MNDSEKDVSDPLEAYQDFRGDIREAASDVGVELTDEQAEAIAQAAMDHLEEVVYPDDWYAENPDWYKADTDREAHQ